MTQAVPAGRLPGATLVVVDMQAAFRDAASEWAVQRYDEIAPRIAALADAFTGRVVWTRFVRDPDEVGAWADYYDRWTTFRVGEEHAAWDLTFEPAAADAVVTLPTFSKWGPELASLAGVDAPVVVCGVATDCCVLSTVLGAIDAGRTVVVATDACAAVSDEAQEQTLALLGLLSPMVVLSTADELLAAV